MTLVGQGANYFMDYPLSFINLILIILDLVTGKNSEGDIFAGNTRSPVYISGILSSMYYKFQDYRKAGYWKDKDKGY